MILLVSLPVTFFPIVVGIKGAWSFHFWNREQVPKNINALQFEADSRSRLNYFNVPGAMSIHDFMDQKGPFHIPKLSTDNWVDQLGLKQPSEHSDPSVGVDKLASFDGLVRDVGAFNQHAGKPKRYWVYVTEAATWFRSEWDEAFDEILEQSYVTPLPSDYLLTYLDCARSAFLCGVWSIKAPSLLSFTVGNETLLEQQKRAAGESENNQDDEAGWLDGLLEKDYTYHSWDGSLYPVTVRVIELPLEEAQPLLSRNTLPTPAIQLRALLLDPDPDALLEHWEPFDQMTQILRRFNDMNNDLSEKVGTWRYYLSEIDSWYSRTVLEPIFGKEFTGNSGFLAEVQSIVFTLGLVVGQLLQFPCTMVWNLYAWFFGLGWDGQPIPDEIPSEPEGNWMEDLFQGAIAGMFKNLSDIAKESAGRAAVTEA